MTPGSEHAQYIRAGSDCLWWFVNEPHPSAALRTCVFFQPKHMLVLLSPIFFFPQPQVKFSKYLVSLDTQGLGQESPSSVLDGKQTSRRLCSMSGRYCPGWLILSPLLHLHCHNTKWTVPLFQNGGGQRRAMKNLRLLAWKNRCIDMLSRYVHRTPFNTSHL